RLSANPATCPARENSSIVGLPPSACSPATTGTCCGAFACSESDLLSVSEPVGEEGFAGVLMRVSIWACITQAANHNVTRARVFIRILRNNNGVAGGEQNILVRLSSSQRALIVKSDPSALPSRLFAQNID